MDSSKDLSNLLKALADFRNKSPLVKATKENPFLKNKYADYNIIVAETTPHLQENGLVVQQVVTNIDGKTAIYTMLMHTPSGESIGAIAPVAHKDSDPQSQGSGITYMKRYAYVAILGLIVDKDDDGNLAAGLGKVAEKNNKVEKAILLLEKATSEGELKTAFMSLGDLAKDKRVIAAKDEKKKALNI
jgi:hypothetical protein